MQYLTILYVLTQVKEYKKGISVPSISKTPGDFDIAEYNFAALLTKKGTKRFSCRLKHILMSILALENYRYESLWMEQNLPKQSSYILFSFAIMTGKESVSSEGK